MAKHVVGPVQRREETSNRATARCVDEFRPDFRRRLKYEPSHGHARMRQRQSRLVNLKFVVQQQIEVDRAGRPPLPPGPSGLLFRR